MSFLQASALGCKDTPSPSSQRQGPLFPSLDPWVTLTSREAPAGTLPRNLSPSPACTLLLLPQPTQLLSRAPAPSPRVSGAPDIRFGKGSAESGSGEGRAAAACLGWMLGPDRDHEFSWTHCREETACSGSHVAVTASGC